jgi:plastocyanin
MRVRALLLTGVVATLTMVGLVAPASARVQAKNPPVLMILEGNKFHPEMFTVKVGTVKIEITNRDPDQHFLSIKQKGLKASMTVAAGATETLTFKVKKPGKYKYFSDGEPAMKGVMTVTK